MNCCEECSVTAFGDVHAFCKYGDEGVAKAYVQNEKIRDRS